MKKVFAFAMAAVFLLCGCSGKKQETREVQSGKDYIDKKNDELMLSIMDTLERGDSDDLLAFFIPLAREEAIHIEDCAAWLLSSYQGSMTGWERIEGYRDESSNADASVLRSMSRYRIITSEAQYELYLHRREIHTDYRNEEGLYKLRLVPEADSTKNAYMPYGGIYITEPQIAHAYALKIIQALEQNSPGAYEELLLPELRDGQKLSYFEYIREERYKGEMVECWSAQGYGAVGNRSGYSIPDARTEKHYAYVYVKTTEGLYKFEVKWLDVRYPGDAPNERYLVSFSFDEADEIPEDYVLY